MSTSDFESFPLEKTRENFGKPSANGVQRVLTSNHLVGRHSENAHLLTPVDPRAPEAPSVPQTPIIDWTPVSQYADKFHGWNQQFGLGLLDEEIDGLASLRDHAGSYQPTTTSRTFDKGLQQDWEVVMQILKHEVEKLGEQFTLRRNASPQSYFPGSEPVGGNKAGLTTAYLDIGEYWDRQNGLETKAVREQRSRWPGLEVAWLLTLSPQVFLAMDGDTVPYMLAAGLTIGSNGLPHFECNRDGAFVRNNWDDAVNFRYSVVAFQVW